MVDRNSDGTFAEEHRSLAKKGVHLGVRNSPATEFKPGQAPWNAKNGAYIDCFECHFEVTFGYRDFDSALRWGVPPRRRATYMKEKAV